jgi:hypothetical protein
MHHHSNPTATKKEYYAIRNILKSFPEITKNLETCEELVRSIKGKRMQVFHKSCIAKWKLFGNRVNGNMSESDLGIFEVFLQTKIDEYTKEHEKMLAEGVTFTPRDFQFVPRYHDIAKEYLQKTYTYEQLDEHFSRTNKKCSIAKELLGACDEIFITRFPNTYNTVEDLVQARKNSNPCTAKKLIVHALEDHPGRPRETVTHDPPGSDGLSILAAAATLADEAPAAAASLFEATADPSLSSIEKELWSLQLDLMEPGGTESGGFGSAQPESPRTEGELRCCPSLPLPNATSSPAAATPPPPLGELRPDILLATPLPPPPPPCALPPARAEGRWRTAGGRR